MYSQGLRPLACKITVVMQLKIRNVAQVMWLQMTPSGPRWPKDDSRWPKVSPKWIRKALKSRSVKVPSLTERAWGPNVAQDGSKMSPRCAQDGPKKAPSGPKMAPRWLKMAQDDPLWV